MQLADIILINTITRMLIYFIIFGILFSVLNISDLIIRIGLVLFIVVGFGPKIINFSDKITEEIIKMVDAYEQRKKISEDNKGRL